MTSFLGRLSKNRFQLPSSATWEDLMHEIYVRETIERGLADSKANRTKDVKDIRKKYSLSE